MTGILFISQKLHLLFYFLEVDAIYALAVESVLCAADALFITGYMAAVCAGL